ncbi:hypothetical protein [Bradyrhizobium sp. AZCC 1678]|uniref:hypothetical protein n=1 Tax=Bradyrhizobium sp. AZCC 1678 TaxID=3117030 RepID=UPI002FF2AD4C
MRWLIPRLHRFTQVHPGIDVRLSTDKEHIDPERGSFDLVITVIDGTGARPCCLNRVGGIWGLVDHADVQSIFYLFK